MGHQDLQKFFAQTNQAKVVLATNTLLLLPKALKSRAMKHHRPRYVFKTGQLKNPELTDATTKTYSPLFLIGSVHFRLGRSLAEKMHSH